MKNQTLSNSQFKRVGKRRNIALSWKTPEGYLFDCAGLLTVKRREAGWNLRINKETDVGARSRTS